MKQDIKYANMYPWMPMNLSSPKTWSSYGGSRGNIKEWECRFIDMDTGEKCRAILTDVLSRKPSKYCEKHKEEMRRFQNSASWRKAKALRGVP